MNKIMKKMMSVLLILTMSVGLIQPITVSAADTVEVYLSDIEWAEQSCGASSDYPNGTARDTNINGDTMRLLINGQVTSFDKGLGIHGPSSVTYNIAGKGYTSFEAYVGVDYSQYSNYPAEGIIGNFIVEIDGSVVAESGAMNPTMNAHYFQVAIPEGAQTIELSTEIGELEDWCDWGNWADAKFIQDPDKVTNTDGPTLNPVQGNEIQVKVEDGKINLYRGEVLVATSASLGSVTANGTTVSDFQITGSEIETAVETERGTANRLTLNMYSEGANLEKTLQIDLLDEVDGAIYTTTYLKAQEDTTITKVVENEFRLAAPDADRIWSYNGGGEGAQSYYDTLQKVSNSFYRENKQDDTSAAIPVADVYSVNGGVLVGDGADYRRILSTPVRGGSNSATVSIQWRSSQELAADTETEAGTAIVSVHDGDYYNALRTYANVMELQGFSTPDYIPESSYDLRWESWGWEGAWTIDKILGKLDELYAQGVRQITLDDCWYTSAGDWELNPNKFPNGTEDMKRLTDAVHEKGMTIILWWRPMDGGRDSSFSVLAGFTQQESQLLKEHPEYFVKNADGSFAKLSGPGNSNSFNGSTGYALCPYSEGAVESQKAFIRRAMTEWGIDGFKSDYVWGMPKCYNEAHNHERPEESTEMASEIFYKAIYEEMISINKDAFHLLCNCGTPQDYYSFPYVTQIPTADPTSVDQTRRRVKAYKALAGDDFPITTDHNEIWYPSSVGTGAILIEKRDFADGSAQETEYYKWLNIADEHKLQEGTHIGDLYAYGIDPYETYVIEKDDMMYYSFYRDGKYSPSGNPDIELKGLDPNKTYRIEDYVNNEVLAEGVSGADAVLEADFSSYLLIRAVEEKAENPFVDVIENDYFYNAVLWAVGEGITDGTSATTFEPNEVCTRGQVVTFLYRAAGSPKVSAGENPFADVTESDYFYDAVLWAVGEGITDGTSAATFSPNEKCTRAQVATFLWRAEGEAEPTITEHAFTDLPSGAYYYDAVLWAVEQGITDGVSDTTFVPDAECTRGQIVTFLYRAK